MSSPVFTQISFIHCVLWNARDETKMIIIGLNQERTITNFRLYEAKFCVPHLPLGHLWFYVISKCNIWTDSEHELGQFSDSDDAIMGMFEFKENLNNGQRSKMNGKFCLFVFFNSSCCRRGAASPDHAFLNWDNRTVKSCCLCRELGEINILGKKKIWFAWKTFGNIFAKGGRGCWTQIHF